ncbi:MAG: hypothetical protein ACI96W_002609 [Paraglaciecola sp.]|jgi:hypothetical protein
MLQQIATVNTDIAALIPEPFTTDEANLKLADEFAYMLKHQQTDNQRNTQSYKLAQVATGKADMVPNAEQQVISPPEEKPPSLDKKDLEEKTDSPLILNDQTNVLHRTVKGSDGQANPQSDSELVNFIEENEWLLPMAKRVNNVRQSGSQPPDTGGHNLSSATELQQETSEQLNNSDDGINTKMQGDIHTLFPHDPNINEAFAQLLAQYKQPEVGGESVLPLEEQQLLEVLQEASPLSSEGPVAIDQTIDSEVLVILPHVSLSQIIQLPKDKLDKVLGYLEHKLNPGNSTAKMIDSITTEDQQNVNLGLDNTLDKTAGMSDFVTILKAGIADVKAQLSQGRESGIDLKGLVIEALKTTREPGQSVVVNLPEQQLDLTLKAFTHTLESAQQLNSALPHSSPINAVNDIYRESGQLQGEQVKSSQLHTSQLHTRYLDNVLNLSKPEAYQQLAEKVRWMVNHIQLVADIRLDPAELGSMHVKVSLTGESANVSFVVNSAQAKEAVDNATPKLREMLAEKGIELGQSTVEQEQNNQGQQMAGNDPHSGQEVPEESVIHDELIQQPIVNGALGGIDYFV